MARFVAKVPLRWADQDAYRHVNHARAVSLLEEARIDLMFDAAAEQGITGFASGLLVAGLNVAYHRQIRYGSRPLRVAMWIDELRAASFRIRYALHDGPDDVDPVAITAWTRMALFDLDAGHPRRVTAAERTFLERWGDVA